MTKSFMDWSRNPSYYQAQQQNRGDAMLEAYYNANTTTETWKSKLLRRMKPTKEQWNLLSILGIQLLIIIVCYQFTITSWLLYPFSLISTVFHEFGHATMCWITGGKVLGIEINPNESGFTRFVGGWHCFVLPSGN